MWLAILAAAVLIAVLVVHALPSTIPACKKLPPGRSRWYHLYDTIEMYSDFKKYSLGRKKEYGNIFCANIHFSPYCVAGGGQKYTEWWAKEDKQSINMIFPHPIDELLGKNTVVTVNGEEHAILRKNILVALVPRSVEHYMSALCCGADRFIAEAPIAMSDSYSFIKRHVFLTTCNVLLGEDLGSQGNELLQKFSTWISAIGAVPINLPFTKLGRGFAAMRGLNKTLAAVLQNHELSPSEPDSENEQSKTAVDQIIQACKQAREEGYNSDLVGTLRVLLFAAHDTTSSTMAVILMVLYNHAHICNKLLKEIFVTFPEKNEPLDYHKVKSMRYLDAFLKEVLRMYPAIPYLVRKVEKDTKVDGYFIPKGYHAYMLPFITHYDETIYPSPHEFKPERFLDAATPPHTFFGFGDGPRQCLGMELGKTLLKVFTVAVMRKMTWQIENVRMHNMVTIPSYIFDIKFTCKE